MARWHLRLAPWAAVLLLCGAGLEDEMSQTEFKRAGLDKLSAEELDFLNAYLGRDALPPRPVASAPSPVQAVASSQPEAPQGSVRSEEPIKSRIRGEFRGWDGHTRFVLENGQVWQQRVAGTYRHRVSNPTVSIAKGRFGHYLVLQSTGRRIGVKQVR